MNAVLKKIINQQMDAFKSDMYSFISILTTPYKKGIILFATLLSFHFSQAQLDVKFTADKSSVCVNGSVTFTDQSLLNGVSLTAANTPSYSWTFQDPNLNLGVPTTTTSPTFSKTFTKGGIWHITLEVDLGTYKSSFVGIIFVAENPVVDFIPDVKQGCMPLAVKFTDKTVPFSSTGTDQDGNPVNYTDIIVSRDWDFDGASSLGQTNPSIDYIYKYASTYSPKLVVKTKSGCVSPALQKIGLITVLQTPTVPSFDPPSLTSTCSFPVQGSPNNVSAASTYAWTIDGSATFDNPSLATPKITFPKEGTYSITLTVASGNGCKNFITNSITLLPNASGTDFSTPPGDLCQNASFTFVRTSTPSTPSTPTS